MAFIRPLAALSLAASCLLACAQSGVIGGAYHAPEYDWGEFYAVTDGRNFQVIVSGNPFPSLSEAEMERRLLPLMQANKPRPNLAFTYDPPPQMPRPYYRLVLVFNSANDLNANRVCAGEIHHKPEPTRSFDLYAIYCRNDLPLSISRCSVAGRCGRSGGGSSGPGADPEASSQHQQVVLPETWCFSFCSTPVTPS
jgi:hypothetical protein